MSDFQSADMLPGAPLESVLHTEALDRRPARPPDYEMENRALVALAQALADSPGTILQAVADTILDVCGCGSAGVSLVTVDEKRFYWPAVAGAWRPHIGRGTPRNFGPCGDVLDRNMPLLFDHPERRYTYFHQVSPLVVEALLVPLYAQGEAVGTLWAVSHDLQARQFDNEDRRLLLSLSRFASAAYWAVESLGQQEHQGKTLSDVRQANEALLLSSVRQHELTEQGAVALRASESTLRQRNSQLSTFLETSAIALHRVGPDGTILWANMAELEMLGYARDEYIGHPISEFHVDQSLITDILRRLYQGEKLHECEAQLKCHDGSILTVLINSSALFQDGRFVHTQCFTRDITERKRAEAALRLAHNHTQHTADRLARLQKVTAALSEALTPAQVADVIVDLGVPALGAASGSVLLLSDDEQMLQMLRSAAPEPVTRPYQRFALSVQVPVTDALRLGQPLWIESRQQYLEQYPHLAEQIAIWGHESAAALPIIDQGRKLGVLTLSFDQAAAFSPEDQDYALTLARLCAQALERARLYENEQNARTELEARVRERTTELEQLSAQLRDLSARVQSTREAERARLSLELHDQLGGSLTGLKMEIAKIYRHESRGVPKEGLIHLMAAVDEMVQLVRQLATELRPGILDDFGLGAAIEWELQEFERRSGIHCRFVSEETELGLERDAATTVFRIFQEALTNVARHAQATEVNVQLRQHAGVLELRVSDNGHGINTGALTHQKSLGLMGMRERVRLLSGEIIIEGVPGQGTTIVVKDSSVGGLNFRSSPARNVWTATQMADRAKKRSVHHIASASEPTALDGFSGGQQ